MILFLGAIEDEVNLLISELDGKFLRFPANDAEPEKIIVRSCGIGNLAAAVNLLELNAAHPDIREIIFFGSAGSYAEKKHSRIISNNFIQTDLAVAEGRAKKPVLMTSSISTKAGRVDSILTERLNLFRGTVNSPDSITLVRTDSFPPDTYENLEAFGLAYVSLRMNIPFTCIMPITNTVGPSGSNEWSINYRIMSNDLQQDILKHLSFHE